jgi:argininosuccinate synthase
VKVSLKMNSIKKRESVEILTADMNSLIELESRCFYECPNILIRLLAWCSGLKLLVSFGE